VPTWLFSPTITPFTAMLLAAIVVAGVVVGPFLAKLAELRYEARRRRQRQADMAVALRAEIGAGRERIADQSRESELKYLLANDFPFGPSDRTDFVFGGLKSELLLLPQPVIEGVVRYYKLAEQSNLLIDYLLKEQYGTQGPDERRKYRENIVAALRDQDAAAIAAIRALDYYLDGVRERRRLGPPNETVALLSNILSLALLAGLLALWPRT
jgi:hypothetical protein